MQPSNDLQQKARLIEVNRQRLEQLQNQISQLETIQKEHMDIGVSLKALSLKDKKSKPSLLPIGAGVHLPFSSTDKDGVMIDIGGGLIAEKPYSEAVVILQKRVTDIGIVINQLFDEAKTMEQRIAKMAGSFNEAAANFTPPLTPAIKSNEDTSESANQPHPSDDKKEKSPKPQKRRKGFGGELTLDD